jgi:secreted Zn-dependent insulinase-like peptidase
LDSLEKLFVDNFDSVPSYRGAKIDPAKKYPDVPTFPDHVLGKVVWYKPHINWKILNIVVPISKTKYRKEYGYRGIVNELLESK